MGGEKEEEPGMGEGKEGCVCMKAISLGRGGKVVAAISYQEVGSELGA